ncbi:MAG: TVP38/TMEM64 family protein [Planctomycetota bacterium]
MTTATHSDSNARRGLLAIRLGVLLPLVAFAVAFFAYAPLRATLQDGIGLLLAGDLPGLQVWGGELGLWAPLATSFLMVIQALIAPIPAVLVTATNSLLFGPFLGGILSIVSASVAAVICYFLARTFGELLVVRLIPQSSLERADQLIEKHGVTAVLLARLIPFVPFDPISFMAGLARMRLAPFFWATVVGQIPAGMTYSYLAQEMDQPTSFILKAICAFASLLLFGLFVRFVILRRRLAAHDSS